ncbi:MAG TPA: hypothetical protein VIV11_17050 [Kofleriaceae bacterium]
MRLRYLLISCVACGGGTVSSGGDLDMVTVASVAGPGNAAAGNAAALDCGDPVLADQVTSGGQRVITWKPCFDPADEPAEVEGDVIAGMSAPELAACEAVPLGERGHSPLAHKRSIDKIEPVYDDGQLAGARIVFKRVRGLNAEWVRLGIECQRARWAVVGNEAGFSPSDPTLVEGVAADVIERNGRVEVIITAETAERADIVLARARGETGLRNARR